MKHGQRAVCETTSSAVADPHAVADGELVRPAASRLDRSGSRRHCAHAQLAPELAPATAGVVLARGSVDRLVGTRLCDGQIGLRRRRAEVCTPSTRTGPATRRLEARRLVDRSSRCHVVCRGSPTLTRDDVHGRLNRAGSRPRRFGRRARRIAPTRDRSATTSRASGGRRLRSAMRDIVSEPGTTARSRVAWRFLLIVLLLLLDRRRAARRRSAEAVRRARCSALRAGRP